MEKKVAICITGELRTIYKTHQMMKKNLIDKNNADIFVYVDLKDRDKPIINKYGSIQNYYKHIWGDNVKGVILYSDADKQEYQDLLRWLLKYKPHLAREKIIPNYGYMLSGGTIVEYYMLYKCGRIMMEYEKKHNFYYDYVVRCRNDVLITNEWNITEAMSNPSNDWLSYLNYSISKIEECKSKKLPFIYVFRGNVVWFTTRQIAGSIFNMIFCYGDNVDVNSIFNWCAEKQFELYVKSQGVVYLNHKTDIQEKYLTSRSSNISLFTRESNQIPDCLYENWIFTNPEPKLHITIIRLNGYKFDKN